MRGFVINGLKIGIPISFGIFLIWFIYKDLSEKDKSDILLSFRQADYSWLVISFFIGILSHVSRAYRWLIMLDTMGYKPKFVNSFFSVMIGYLANMVFPRLGEVSRCAAMTKYENIPFQNSFGTVMAERVIDMLILLVLTLITILTQYNLIGDFLFSEAINPLLLKFQNTSNSFGQKLLLSLLFIGVIFLILFFIKRKARSIYNKVKELLIGFAEGFKTVLKIKKPLSFIAHTLFIWILYYLMLHVCFFALKETADTSILAVLSVLVFGSFGVIAVQGGLGAYPVIVSKTLTLYGISLPVGFAFGWIVWTGQAIMIVLVGLVSVILMPGYNKKLKNYAFQGDNSGQDIA